MLLGASGGGAAARAWAPARGSAAGAGCGSARTAGTPWRRSSSRCGGRARRRASRGYFSPWHWPHRRYDSSNGTRSPLARCRKSRLVASWQSRHQRWVSSCFRTISVCISVSSRRVRLTGCRRGSPEQGKMPSENGGGGTSSAPPGSGAPSFAGGATLSRRRQQRHPDSSQDATPSPSPFRHSAAPPCAGSPAATSPGTTAAAAPITLARFSDDRISAISGWPAK